MSDTTEALIVVDGDSLVELLAATEAAIAARLGAQDTRSRPETHRAELAAA